MNGETTFRTVDLREAGASSAAEGCEACGRPTSNGKPFCVEHLGRMAYVGKLLRELGATSSGARIVPLRPSLRRAV